MFCQVSALGVNARGCSAGTCSQRLTSAPAPMIVDQIRVRKLTCQRPWHHHTISHQLDPRLLLLPSHHHRSHPPPPLPHRLPQPFPFPFPSPSSLPTMPSWKLYSKPGSPPFAYW